MTMQLAPSHETADSCCGPAAVTRSPTGPGNGAMEALASEGAFRPPRLDDIERSAALALAHIRRYARVFVDVWDLEQFSACAANQRLLMW
jgi:hypothetical protein